MLTCLPSTPNCRCHTAVLPSADQKRRITGKIQDSVIHAQKSDLHCLVLAALPFCHLSWKACLLILSQTVLKVSRAQHPDWPS